MTLKMRRRISACAGIAALALVGVDLVAAQQPTSAQQNAIRQACRSDYQAVCASVPTGGSAALQCLRQNAGSVSAPCQQALAAVGGGSSGNGGAAPGAGAMGAGAAAAPPAAMTANPGAASAPQSAGASRMTMREELMLTRAECGQDYRTYCQRVQPGGGRAIKCLEANGTSLTPTCQQALMGLKQKMQ